MYFYRSPDSAVFYVVTTNSTTLSFYHHSFCIPYSSTSPLPFYQCSGFITTNECLVDNVKKECCVAWDDCSVNKNKAPCSDGSGGSDGSDGSYGLVPAMSSTDSTSNIREGGVSLKALLALIAGFVVLLVIFFVIFVIKKQSNIINRSIDSTKVLPSSPNCEFSKARAWK